MTEKLLDGLQVELLSVRVLHVDLRARQITLCAWEGHAVYQRLIAF